MNIDHIYQQLSSALKEQSSDVFVYENEYQNIKETFVITRENLYHVADDILNNHPRILQYREAVHCLIKNELLMPNKEIHSNSKYWITSNDPCYMEYVSIRDDMLNLETPYSPSVVDSLYEIKYNPCTNLSNDAVLNKYYRDLLMYKLWRTKLDFDNKVDKDTIYKQMLVDISTDGRHALKQNKYVFAAFWEFATKV